MSTPSPTPQPAGTPFITTPELIQNPKSELKAGRDYLLVASGNDIDVVDSAIITQRLENVEEAVLNAQLTADHNADEIALSNTQIAINSQAIDVINGDQNTSGSIKRSLKDSKDYTDEVVANTRSEIEEDVNTKVSVLATKAELNRKIEDLINGAPETLDTLKEIADVLEENTEAIDAINALAATKADKDSVYTKTEINDKLSDIGDDLDAEVTRSKAEESRLEGLISTNKTNITNETTRAMAAEDAIDTKAKNNTTEINTLKANLSTTNSDLEAETTRAQAEESRIEGKVDSEVTRAKAAESAIDTKVNTNIDDITNLKTDTETLRTDLTAENSRASQEEGRIEGKLDDEITRATQEEGRIEGKVDSEAERATQEEAAINAKIGTNTTDITKNKTDISTLRNDLTSETTRATDEEERIEGKVDSETARATAAEGTLNTKIGNNATEIGTIKNNISTLQTNLGEETTRATEEEGRIEGKIDAEVTRAKAAETTISGNVSTNATNISTLQTNLGTTNTNLSNEVTRAKAEEKRIEEKEDAAISAETERATGEEERIENLISEVAVDLSELAEDVDDNATAISNEITRASVEEARIEGVITTAKTELNTAISAVDQKADGAKADVVTEANRAKGAEGNLSTQITNLTSAYNSTKAIVEANQSAIAIINGDNATAGSIAKSLKDSKDYTDSAINTLSQQASQSANAYTDQKIAALINGAPETLDTLKEVADALSESNDAVEALNTAIGTKANASDVYTKSQTYTKTEVDNKVKVKANASDVYTKTEINAKETALNNSISANASAIETINGGEAVNGSIAKSLKDAKDYTDSMIATTEGKIPSKLSQLSNDSGYAKSSDVYTKTQVDNKLAAKANASDVTASLNTKADSSDVYTKTEVDGMIPTVPSNVSAFTNDAGYAKTTDMNTALNKKANISDMNTALAAKANSDDVYTKSQVYTKDEVDDMIPTVPTKLSQLTNDAGYAKTSAVNSALANKANSADVYTKTEVDGMIPTIPTNISSFTNDAGYAKTSTVNSALANKANSADVYNKTETYTKTEVDNKIPSVPTKVSQLTNDSGYAKTTEMNTALAGKANSADVYTKSEVDGMIPTVPTKVSQLTNDSNYVTSTSLSTTLNSYVLSTTLSSYAKSADVYTKTTADSTFVKKVSGKGLSTNDFTTDEKNKLATCVTPDSLSTTLSDYVTDQNLSMQLSSYASLDGQEALTNKTYNGYTLGPACAKSVATSIGTTGSDSNLATEKAVRSAINALPTPMQFLGTVGTGGTVTSLPAAAASNNGNAYKVIKAGTYGSVAAKVGDMLISNGSSWVLIPSGDEPSGTVTSVTLTQGTGIVVSNSGTAITSSGTRTISLAESGVTEGSAGPTQNVSGSNNSTINIPSLTVDKYGRVTALTSYTLTNVNTDTHYTTHLYAGSGTAANAATTNGNTKLSVTDNSTVRNSVTIKGAGGTTVTSDASGNITIESTDTDTHQEVVNNNPTLAWGATATVGSIGGTELTLKMPANPNTNTHYTSHLYAGTGTAANATTTNGNTKLTLADDSTVRNTITIKGSGTTTVKSDASGVITIESADSKTGTVTSVAGGTGLDGGTITGSGTLSVKYGTTEGTACQGNDSRLSDSRTPKAHNQASNTINAMTGYTKASTEAAIAATDSLNTAIGKLEKALDGKQATGSYVTTDDSRLTDARTPKSHNQASNTITAMTGYSKGSSSAAIAATDSLNTAIGKLEKALDNKQASGSYVTTSDSRLTDARTPLDHEQASSTITAMTGYAKASASAAIAATDSLNTAIGKLEKALDGKQASGSYVTLTGSQALTNKTYNGYTLGAACAKGVATSIGATGSDSNLATEKAVRSAISALPTPMQFLGTLGTGGTATTLPAAAAANNGNAYKVITAGTYQSVAAKVGDMLISNGSAWVLIPSGDEPSGTVTSVTITQGDGISVTSSGTAITSSGTRTISLATSGATAGTYGPSADVTGNNNATVAIPSITVDKYGRVTGITTYTLTNVDTNTHYTSHLYAGSGTAANAATTNGNTKLSVVDNTTVRNSITIKGTGGTTVTSDANGVITIDSTDTDTHQEVVNSAPTLAWGTTSTIGTIGGTALTVKMPANPNTNTHYTSHLYAGTGAAKNASTTNGNTKLTLVDDSTVRNTVTIQGSGTTVVTSDANGVITITSADSNTGTVTSVVGGTGLDGGTITDSGTLSVKYGTTAGTACQGNDSRLSDSRTPKAHNQASSTITAMTSYSKPNSTSAIATTDSLNTAIGKLEKALDGKQASGDYVTTNDSRLTDSRTPKSHNQASSTINAMTGYSKASSAAAISTSDSLNTAIGKLEKGLDGKVSTVSGKGLSTNDYTTAEKNKLAAIPNFWKGTQAEYDAITNKDSNTIYMIKQDD